MKISTKVECGIIALMDIAINSENGNVVKVASISKRNKDKSFQIVKTKVFQIVKIQLTNFIK